MASHGIELMMFEVWTTSFVFIFTYFSQAKGGRQPGHHILLTSLIFGFPPKKIYCKFAMHGTSDRCIQYSAIQTSWIEPVFLHVHLKEEGWIMDGMKKILVLVVNLDWRKVKLILSKYKEINSIGLLFFYNRWSL